MSAKHTPAPWTVSGKQVKSIDHGKRYTVATANNPKFTDEANASNARLIAAAPDLLAVLQEAVRVLDYAADALDAPEASHFRATIADARAAIAKVTGENT